MLNGRRCVYYGDDYCNLDNYRCIGLCGRFLDSLEDITEQIEKPPVLTHSASSL